VDGEFLLPVGGGLLGLIVFLTSLASPAQEVARKGAAFAVIACVATYLAWRFGNLPTELSDAETGFAIAFLAVEVTCLASFVLLAVMLSRSTEAMRSAQADAGESRLRALPPEAHPHVDVWIATYDEDWEILEKTIVGALAIDWPRERLAIHVLDDGRRPWLARECEALGVGYITRSDNRHRKAGNHNNALALTSAPFILSVDADFVVFPNILYRTMGLLEDPEVAAVQTPQAYYNVDTTRRALAFAGRSPVGFDGIDLFYRSFQPARDAWRSSFYCGTSAVLRRAALEDIDGFVTETDIEDEATSVKLLSRGWRVAFLNEILSNGLAAESGRAYHDQRNRWCRGSLQINYTSFGSFSRRCGLSPMQRILFLQHEWVLGSIYPIVFAIAPAIMWLTGWRLYADVSSWQALLFPLLLFASICAYLTWITQRLWLPVLSQAVELYTAVAMWPTMVSTLIKPFGKPLTRILPVTQKGAAAGLGGLNVAAALPLGVIIVLLAGTLAWRTLGDSPVPLEPPEIVALLVWTALNLLIVAVALRACVEPEASCREPWFDVDLPARLSGQADDLRVEALSLTGAVVRSVSTSATSEPAPERSPSLEGREIRIGGLPPLVCRRCQDLDDGRTWIDFADVSPAVRRALITLLYVQPDPEEVVPDIEAIPIYTRVITRSLFS